MDTRKTLSLDRSSLTSFGKDSAREILAEFVNLYIDTVIEKLKNGNLEKILESDKFDAYQFWLACFPEQRKKLPKEYITYIKDEVEVIEKNSEGTYECRKNKVSQILANFPNNVLFANIKPFESYIGEKAIKYLEICNILNENVLDEDLPIIIDGKLVSASLDYQWKNVIKPNLKDKLIIYSAVAECEGLKVESSLKEQFILGLDSAIEGADYGYFNTTKGKRYAIPAINEYEYIAVKHMPYGLLKPNFNCNWIIAPFTSDYGKKISVMSKEQFVKDVMETKTFATLVEYIKEHGIFKDDISETDIKRCYRRLIEEFYEVKGK